MSLILHHTIYRVVQKNRHKVYGTKILQPYIIEVDKLKWYINSEWAAWVMQLLNMLLANGVNVHRLRLCCRKTFWAHAEMKMIDVIRVIF